MSGNSFGKIFTVTTYGLIRKLDHLVSSSTAIRLLLFLILIISSHIFANNSQTLKFFENNVLLGCFGSGCGPINTGPVWYVGVDGNDGTDGSIENPFASIQYAIDGAVDGDS